MKKVSIGPDHTPRQMIEKKKLKEEFDQRTQLGERDLTIHNLNRVNLPYRQSREPAGSGNPSFRPSQPNK